MCQENVNKKPRQELRWLRWLKCAGLSNFLHSTNDQELLEPIKNE